MLILLSVLWVMWKERNSRTFEGIEKDFNCIKNRWIHTFGFLLLGQ